MHAPDGRSIELSNTILPLWEYCQSHIHGIWFYHAAGNTGMEDNLDLDAEFRVRLPSPLAERIANEAKKERRSRNLQYVFMLENWFELKTNLEDRIKRLEAVVAKET